MTLLPLYLSVFLCHYYEISAPVLISVFSVTTMALPLQYLSVFLCHYYDISAPVLISVFSVTSMTHLPQYLSVGGGRVVRWSWVNFQCRCVLLVWIRVGQGPTALAVGAGGGCLDFFYFHLSFLFSFFLSLGDDPI